MVKWDFTSVSLKSNASAWQQLTIILNYVNILYKGYEGINEICWKPASTVFCFCIKIISGMKVAIMLTDQHQRKLSRDWMEVLGTTEVGNKDRLAVIKGQWTKAQISSNWHKSKCIQLIECMVLRDDGNRLKSSLQKWIIKQLVKMQGYWEWVRYSEKSDHFLKKAEADEMPPPPRGFTILQFYLVHLKKLFFKWGNLYFKPLQNKQQCCKCTIPAWLSKKANLNKVCWIYL